MEQGERRAYLVMLAESIARRNANLVCPDVMPVLLCRRKEQKDSEHVFGYLKEKNTHLKQRARKPQK